MIFPFYEQDLIIIAALTLLSAGFILYYRAPREMSADVTVYDGAGNELSARLALTLSRSLLRPDKITGKIYIGDKVYQSWVEINTQGEGIFDGIKNKLRGKIRPAVFINSANLGGEATAILSDLIYLNDIIIKNGSIDAVSLSGTYKNHPFT